MISIPFSNRRFKRQKKFDVVNEYRSQYAAPRDRMTVSGQAARLYPNTQDWTGSMKPSRTQRNRAVEGKPKKIPLLSGDGVRDDVVKAIVIALAVIFLLLVLSDVAALGKCDSEIQGLMIQIAKESGDAEQLKGEVAQKTGDVKVCTEAVKLNMISSNGAKTIVLTVPEEAGLLPVVAWVNGTESEGLRAAAH